MLLLVNARTLSGLIRGLHGQIWTFVDYVFKRREMLSGRCASANSSKWNAVRRDGWRRKEIYFISRLSSRKNVCMWYTLRGALLPLGNVSFIVKCLHPGRRWCTDTNWCEFLLNVACHVTKLSNFFKLLVDFNVYPDYFKSRPKTLKINFTWNKKKSREIEFPALVSTFAFYFTNLSLKCNTFK